MGATTTAKKGALKAPSGTEEKFSAEYIERRMKAIGGFGNSLPVPLRRVFKARFEEIVSGNMPEESPHVGALEGLFVEKGFARKENGKFTMSTEAQLIIGAWCSGQILLVFSKAEAGTGHEERPLAVQGFVTQGYITHTEERRSTFEDMTATAGAILESLKATREGRRTMPADIAPFIPEQAVAAG